MVDRRNLAKVSDDSIDGWRAFALRHGTTPTALAEVLGVELGKLTTPAEKLPDVLQRTVAESRVIAAARRRRPRRSV